MPAKGWIEVDPYYCKGCELCIPVCPQDVLDMDKGHLTTRGYHPAYLKEEGCTGCAICAVVCPEVAITVYREKPIKKRRPAAAEISA